MPNFCPECGKKIEGTPKFCNECGHPLKETFMNNEVAEIKRNENHLIESTGPAAIDLKAALALVKEVADYIDNRSGIDKSEFKSMEKRLLDAEKILEKAKNIDPNTKVLSPISNGLINFDEALALNEYMCGRLGFDTATEMNMGEMSFLRAMDFAQRNFSMSYNKQDTPWARFYYARAKHEEFNERSKRIFISKDKLKQEVIHCYQYVIDNWPDQNWAIEARKYQLKLQ